MSVAERSAAFEWGFEKGEQAERERIIKLLEKEQQELVIDQNHNGAAVLRDVVALIKGEEQ
jgi:hypothetical protein